MKRFLSIFIIMSIFMSMALQCMAEETTNITAQYDPVEKIVRLSGYSKGNTNIILSEVGSDAASFNAENLPVDLFTLKTYGDFIYSFVMPKDAAAGKYDIYLIDTYSTAKTSFIYYDGAKANDLVTQLKLKTDFSEYKQFIKSNASELGIDITDDIYISNFEKGVTLLFNCDDEFNDSKTFISSLYKYLAISEMRGADSTVIENLIARYEENLDIDYAASFKNNAAYSDAVKDEALNLLSSVDYYKGYTFIKKYNASVSFGDILDMLTVLARVRSVQSYDELKKIYETYLPNIISSDIRYTTSNSKDVFKALIKKEFTELSHLDDNFTIAVTEAIGNTSNVTQIQSDNKVSVTYPSAPKGNTSADPVVSSGAPVSDISKNGFTVSRLSTGDAHFTDLSVDHWSYKAVASMSASGIISGYQDGSFKPDDSITRAEFAKLMVTAFAFTGKTEKTFSDVDDSAWYADCVNIAADHGLITGYDGNFMPEDKIKRQDAILIAYRCAQRVGVTYSGTYNFDDMYDADTYAWPAIFSLAANKVISGDNTNCVNPQREITRAEAAQLIYGLVNDICVKLEK